MIYALDRPRVVVAVEDPSSFEGSILRGAIAYNEHTHQWRFVGTKSKPFSALDDVDFSAIDGLIASFYDREHIQAVIDAGVKAVNTGSHGLGLALPTVSNDDRAVGRMGAEYLLTKGLQHFAFVEQGSQGYSLQRLTGFRDVLEIQARHSVHVHRVMWSKKSPDEWRERLCDWLRGLPRPIGVMAAHDHLGVEIIDAAVDMGFKVPDEVAVLGVDNNIFKTALPAVPLSSIQHDSERVGYTAAKALDALMNGRQPSLFTELIPPIGVASRHSTDLVLTRDPVVSQALAFIRNHFADRITVAGLVKRMGLSRKTLEIRMKQATGKTPHQVICHARIEHAKRLLLESEEQIQQIAYACGFGSQNRLNAVFRRLTGMTPGEFRGRRRYR